MKNNNIILIDRKMEIIHSDVQNKLSVIKEKLEDFYKLETCRWFRDTDLYGLERGYGECKFDFYDKGFDIDKIYRLLTVDDVEFLDTGKKCETIYEFMLLGVISYSKGYKYETYKAFDTMFSMINESSYYADLLTKSNSNISNSNISNSNISNSNISNSDKGSSANENHDMINRIFSSDIAILASFLFCETLQPTYGMTYDEVINHKKHDAKLLITCATVMVNIHYQKEDFNKFPRILRKIMRSHDPKGFTDFAFDTSLWLFELVSLIILHTPTGYIYDLFVTIASYKSEGDLFCRIEYIPFLLCILGRHRSMLEIKEELIRCCHFAQEKGYIYATYMLVLEYQRSKKYEEALNYLKTILYSLPDHDHEYRYKAQDMLGDYYKSIKNYDGAIEQYMTIFKGNHTVEHKTRAVNNIFTIYRNTDINAAMKWFDYISKEHHHTFNDHDIKYFVESAIEQGFHENIYNCMKDNTPYLCILIGRYMKLGSYKHALIIYCKHRKIIHGEFIKDLKKNIWDISYDAEVLKAISSIPKTAIDEYPGFIRVMWNLIHKQIDLMTLHFTYSVNGLGYKQAEDDYYNVASIIRKE